MDEEIIETYFQIEWLVPETQAIGGKSYWYIIYDGYHHNKEYMIELFKTVQKSHDEGTVRLVQKEKKILNPG